jgi:hypothetical protein
VNAPEYVNSRTVTITEDGQYVGVEIPLDSGAWWPFIMDPQGDLPVNEAPNTLRYMLYRFSLNPVSLVVSRMQVGWCGGDIHINGVYGEIL